MASLPVEPGMKHLMVWLSLHHEDGALSSVPAKFGDDKDRVLIKSPQR